MRPPAFWQNDGLIARAFVPFSLFWRLGAWCRRLQTPVRCGVPVFCCGGVTAGGAGKTTVALDLARRLSAQGIAVHCVTRGYGGGHTTTMRVDPLQHDAALVGDEALLLADVAPTWVARHRAQGALAAVAAGAQAIVMDDGFQNPSLMQDCSFLVVDGGTGFGNGHVMPAGPLREPVAAAGQRAHAFILIGPDRRRALENLPPDLPIFRASLRPSVCAVSLQGEKIFAVAGIAFPQKFHASLEQAGALIAGYENFPDHHPFSSADIERTLEKADAMNARPVTTPKDAVRIPPAFRDRFQIVGVELAWDNPDAIDALLAAVMQHGPNR